MNDDAVEDAVRRAAQDQPTRVALIDGAGTMTNAELDVAVDNAAARARDAGVRAGTCVAMLAADTSAAVVHLYAMWRIGAVHVPLNRRAATPELRRQLVDVGAGLLAHDREHAERAAALVDEGLDTIPLDALEIDTRTASGTSWPASDVRRSAPAMVICTSGTSGRPKGAVLTHANLAASADAWATRLRPRPTDVWLACLPLYHVAGAAIVVRAQRWGLPLRIHDRFDASAVNAAIDDGISLLSLVPEMLQAVLDERGDSSAPGSLRHVLLGGGPSSEALLERARSSRLPVMITYGMTETASGIAAGEVARASGRGVPPLLPLPGVGITIGPTEAPRPEGPVSGEIIIAGPMVSPGYVEAGQPLAPRVATRIFRSGDIGTMLPDGSFVIGDRRDDLIISGGENIYPAEVEAVLVTHPRVSDAVVVARPDPRWGAVPVALVSLNDSSEPDEQAILEHCRRQLAAYKVPVAVHIVATVPRSADGKLLRREARADMEVRR